MAHAMAVRLRLALSATLATAFVGLFIQRRRRRRAEAVRFNFGEASSRDGLAHGALRPGKQANALEAPGAVGDAEVREWVEFVRARGVRRVLSLLGDDEIAWYASDLDAAMRAAFRAKLDSSGNGRVNLAEWGKFHGRWSRSGKAMPAYLRGLAATAGTPPLPPAGPTSTSDARAASV